MNSIVIDIEPTIIGLGHFALRWYSLAIILAVVAGLWLASREGKRKGFKEDNVLSAGLWVIIAGIIGARLFHVVDKLDYYLERPSEILAFQQGGLAIWGAVAGGALGLAIYTRYAHLSVARLLDVAAPGLVLGQIIGRFGCIVNGDAYGGPTDLPWGFVYTNPNAMIPEPLKGVATHPYPVYEILWNAALLAGLWVLRKRLTRDGHLFAIYVFFYSLGRFLLTFVRQEQIAWLGLQQAQVLALVGMIVAVIVAFYMTTAPAKARTPVKVRARRG